MREIRNEGGNAGAVINLDAPQAHLKRAVVWVKWGFLGRPRRNQGRRTVFHPAFPEHPLPHTSRRGCVGSRSAHNAPMKLLLLSLLPVLGLPLLALGEKDGDRPPGPPPEREGPGARPPGERGKPPGGPRPDWSGKGPSGRMGSDAERMAFEKLPEEERKRVRKALEEAWGHENVHAAREKVIRANEELRETIRKVLTEIDPHVAEVLEKIRPPGGPGDRGPLPPLDPRSPDFTKRAVERLGMELQTFSRPERHEDTRRFHERLLKTPPVQKAIQELNQLPPEERMDGMAKLRAVYRQAVSAEFKRIREQQAANPKAGGDKPPSPKAGEDQKE